jgi:dihydrofolate reductase
MGRKTFESLPGPLPGRVHGVLSRDPGFAPPGVAVLRGEKEALAWALGRKTFLIGGASVFRALLDHCDTAYVTKIDALGGADAFMPNLEALPGWRLRQAGSWLEHAGLRFRVCVYEHTPR